MKSVTLKSFLEYYYINPGQAPSKKRKIKAAVALFWIFTATLGPLACGLVSWKRGRGFFPKKPKDISSSDQKAERIFSSSHRSKTVSEKKDASKMALLQTEDIHRVKKEIEASLNSYELGRNFLVPGLNFSVDKALKCFKVAAILGNRDAAICYIEIQQFLNWGFIQGNLADPFLSEVKNKFELYHIHGTSQVDQIIFPGWEKQILEYNTAALAVGMPLHEKYEAVTPDKMYSLATKYQAEACKSNKKNLMHPYFLMDPYFIGSFKWCREAAMRGHPSAMDLLAKNYLNGVGCENNPQSAKLWWEALKEIAHFDDALVSLGTIYKEGYGGEVDLAQAIENYELAIEYTEDRDKYIWLMYLLGTLYLMNGPEPDFEKALEWFGDAAERGHKEAMICTIELGLSKFGLEEESQEVIDLRNKAGYFAKGTSHIDKYLKN